MTCPTSPSNRITLTAERRALYDDTSSSNLSYADALSFRGVFAQIPLKQWETSSIFNKQFVRQNQPQQKQQRRSLVKKVAGNVHYKSRQHLSQSLIKMESSSQRLTINPSSLALLDSEAEVPQRDTQQVRLMSPLSQERMQVCMSKCTLYSESTQASFKSQISAQPRAFIPPSQKYMAQLKEGHRFANMRSQKQLRIPVRRKVEQTRSLNQSPNISNCSSKEKLQLSKIPLQLLDLNPEIKPKSYFSTPASPCRRVQGYPIRPRNYQPAKVQNNETRNSDFDDLTKQLSFLSFSSQFSERVLMASKLKKVQQNDEQAPLSVLKQENKLTSTTYEKATSPFSRCLSSDQEEAEFDLKDLLVSGLKIKVKKGAPSSNQASLANTRAKFFPGDLEAHLNQDLMLTDGMQHSEDTISIPHFTTTDSQLTSTHFDGRRKASSLSRPTTPVKTVKVPSINITSKFTRPPASQRRKMATSLSRKMPPNQVRNKKNLTLQEILALRPSAILRDYNEENLSLEISTRCQTVVSQRLDSSSSLASLEEPPSSCKTYKVATPTGKGTESKAPAPSLFARPTLRFKQLI